MKPRSENHRALLSVAASILAWYPGGIDSKFTPRLGSTRLLAEEELLSALFCSKHITKVAASANPQVKNKLYSYKGLQIIQTDTSSLLLTHIKLRTTGLLKNTLYLQDI